MTGADRILVVGPSWVGDMVMAQSLFITLKQAQPECQIDVLAPTWSFPLLERMPEVNKAFAMPLTHGQLGLSARIQLGKSLRPEKYDRAILLPNSWKSALTPYFANIPVRTGYVGECRWGLLNDARKLNKSLLTMTVQRFVALGLAKSSVLPPQYSAPKLLVEKERQQEVAEKFTVDLSKKILALCPGAEYGPAKRWPSDYYAEVAQAKIADGWQVWLFGSDKDKAAAEDINQHCQQACIDFTGRTSLAEAVDLMSLVDAVVTNDSGLMHVAAALDKAIIAIYGSSDPDFTPPLNQQAEVICLNLECSPCFKRECPLYPKEHQDHTKCLTQISPQMVIEKLN